MSVTYPSFYGTFPGNKTGNADQHDMIVYHYGHTHRYSVQVLITSFAPQGFLIKLTGEYHGTQEIPDFAGEYFRVRYIASTGRFILEIYHESTGTTITFSLSTSTILSYQLRHLEFKNSSASLVIPAKITGTNAGTSDQTDTLIPGVSFFTYDFTQLYLNEIWSIVPAEGLYTQIDNPGETQVVDPNFVHLYKYVVDDTTHYRAVENSQIPGDASGTHCATLQANSTLFLFNNTNELQHRFFVKFQKDADEDESPVHKTKMTNILDYVPITTNQINNYQVNQKTMGILGKSAGNQQASGTDLENYHYNIRNIQPNYFTDLGEPNNMNTVVSGHPYAVLSDNVGTSNIRPITDGSHAFGIDKNIFYIAGEVAFLPDNGKVDIGHYMPYVFDTNTAHCEEKNVDGHIVPTASLYGEYGFNLSKVDLLKNNTSASRVRIFLSTDSNSTLSPMVLTYALSKDNTTERNDVSYGTSITRTIQCNKSLKGITDASDSGNYLAIQVGSEQDAINFSVQCPVSFSVPNGKVSDFTNNELDPGIYAETEDDLTGNTSGYFYSHESDSSGTIFACAAYTPNALACTVQLPQGKGIYTGYTTPLNMYHNLHITERTEHTYRNITMPYYTSDAITGYSAVTGFEIQAPTETDAFIIVAYQE